ncbi:hypothetical protein NC652_012385 [Populus alba x Populus x berolinensis]|nr:hypothetical protein NC652_012385 [Populus alba x Populus x berolinensis]
MVCKGQNTKSHRELGGLSMRRELEGEKVDRVVKRLEVKKQRNLEVFEWFLKHMLLVNKKDPSIDDQEALGNNP